LTLEAANDQDLENLGRLYAVLDGSTPGLSGITLSKVLHRKRPGFIPLYDRNVRRLYLRPGVGPARIPAPPRGGRSWSEFMVVLAGAMRDDLQAYLPFWRSLAARAKPVALTPLRALDIVAWKLGRQPSA
jgi:hypothetical protein